MLFFESLLQIFPLYMRACWLAWEGSNCFHFSTAHCEDTPLLFRLGGYSVCGPAKHMSRCNHFVTVQHTIGQHWFAFGASSFLFWVIWSAAGKFSSGNESLFFVHGRSLDHIIRWGLESHSLDRKVVLLAWKLGGWAFWPLYLFII